jgi:predicted HTH domain antitoxin
MPPIRTQSSRNREEQEGRILLAIQAFKKQEITSLREITRVFNVPRTTLRDRLSGHTQRSITRANSHKMTEIEEESLQK